MFDKLKNTVLWLVFFAMFSCQDKISFELEECSKSRVIVLTDILNEADDSQTLVRILMYANKVDLEGLIAVSSCHQYNGKNDSNLDRNTVHPNEIKKFIMAYGKVRNNLILHESDWPTEEYLLSITGAGPTGYGTRDIGIGKSTSGSKIIVNALKKNDSRPLYIVVNGGANCLAQALIDLEMELPALEFEMAVAKLRVCDNAGQDNAAAWIAHNYPQIHIKRSSYQVYNFMNDKGPVVWEQADYIGEGQFLWTQKHVQTNHGALGELYPTRMVWKNPQKYHTIEGGGSGNFIGFANHGLYHPEHIDWGGWGGRFSLQKKLNIYGNQLKWAEPDLHESEAQYKPYYMYPEVAENWVDPETNIEYEGIGVPIFRWRRAYQNDFQARMDWCVNSFEESNHNPVAAVFNDHSNGFFHLDCFENQVLKFDASTSSDPDGDSLTFRWLIYPEAGAMDSELEIVGAQCSEVKIKIPANSVGEQLHLILEVKDNNPVAELYDYRRIIINVIEKK